MDVLDEALPVCSDKIQTKIFKLLIFNQQKAQQKYDELLSQEYPDAVQQAKIGGNDSGNANYADSH